MGESSLAEWLLHTALYITYCKKMLHNVRSLQGLKNNILDSVKYAISAGKWINQY